MTETYLTPVHELIAKLRSDIMAEEMKFAEKREWLEARADIRDQDDADLLDCQIREAYTNMRMSTEPMRRHVEFLLLELARLEAFKPITMLIPTPANA